MNYDSLTDYNALVNALVLAVTAPDDRVDDVLELARAFASRLTPDEVDRAKAEVEQLTRCPRRLAQYVMATEAV